jgi:hypothetical protein
MALNSPSIDVQVYDKAGFQLTGGTDTSARGFWESFTQTLGFGPSNQAMYQEGVQRGGTVVSVSGDDSRVDQIADILNRCGAVDVDTRAEEWKTASWKAKGTQPESRPSATATTPVGDERFTAERLEIRRGNVWVYRRKAA